MAATSEPFFFREPERQLFGCLHAPEGSRARPAGVVLCAPGGHEAIRTHRALRQLAERLARAGFATLRFDRTGCGDSEDDGRDAGLERWCEDLGDAMAACRARSGAARTAVVGLRLGASLALKAAVAGGVDTLVLWDPVRSGREYLEELRAAQRDLVASLPGAARATGPGAGRAPEGEELVGFAYPPALIDELSALDASTLAPAATRRVLLIETDAPGAPAAAGTKRWPTLSERMDSHVVIEPRIWREDADKALVPHKSLALIEGWLTDVYA